MPFTDMISMDSLLDNNQELKAVLNASLNMDPALFDAFMKGDYAIDWVCFLSNCVIK